ncbi:hypothetical protein [Nocardioides albus]|uniref:Uncharacterized protein n=1 Tax=Nocardioides albus TaxID=1841 RepID=A0A7W5AAA7_9ACTN|nr:hypothetical protein [Nocardioides albus]MBB3092129.1 hypothetical protein [Nocardioides albus]GGU45847.1 hypothetical protein GCM10007979_51270 [Nocardioides albus]
MQKTLRMPARLLVCASIGAALALAAGAGAVAVPADPPTAADQITVDGTGGGTLQLPSYRGDTVSFRVHATTDADTPWAAQGSIAVTHVRPDGTVLADFTVAVDCLMAGDDVAVISGKITRGGAPGLPGDEMGHQIGITVADHGRRDHLGWSWYVMGFLDTRPCTSTAPFFPTTAGNFRVEGP